MNTAKKVLEKAQASGKVKEREEYLRLAPKNDQGVPTPNGPHKIKLVSDKAGKDNMGIDKLYVTVLEGKQTKVWPINLKDNEGNLHYLVQRLAEYEPGDELIVEMKKNGAKNFVEMKKVGEILPTDEIPSIDLNADSEETVGGGTAEEADEDSEDEEVPF